MKFEKGMVVISKAGRDSGKVMLVMAAENDFAFVADGKERKVEKPKKKNMKHLRFTRFKIDCETQTNKSLKKALSELDLGQSPEEGE